DGLVFFEKCDFALQDASTFFDGAVQRGIEASGVTAEGLIFFFHTLLPGSDVRSGFASIVEPALAVVDIVIIGVLQIGDAASDFAIGVFGTLLQPFPVAFIKRSEFGKRVRAAHGESLKSVIQVREYFDFANIDTARWLV